jgi:hypothetical protein
VLSGHVQDEDGAPIPGAGVAVLRTSMNPVEDGSEPPPGGAGQRPRRIRNP